MFYYHGTWSDLRTVYDYQLNVDWYTGDGSPVMSDSDSVTVTDGWLIKDFMFQQV